MDDENLSYSELVVIALENLLKRTQEAKKLSISLAGEDSILAGAAKCFEKELLQILSEPKEYLKEKVEQIDLEIGRPPKHKKIVWEKSKEERRAEFEEFLNSVDEDEPVVLIAPSLDSTLSETSSVGLMKKEETIDGREKLIYEIRDSLQRLVSVIEPSDDAINTWAYAYARSILQDTEEWMEDEEHVFSEYFENRRNAYRKQVPK